MHLECTGLFIGELRSGQIIICFFSPAFSSTPPFTCCVLIQEKRTPRATLKSDPQSTVCAECKEAHSGVLSFLCQGRAESDLEVKSVYIGC